MYIPTITLTDEQRQIAEAKARELGYAGPDEYLHDLLSDALEEHARPNVDDGRSKEEILEGLRTSLRQALRGEGRPARELLEELKHGD
jgi:hypothetical protein